MNKERDRPECLCNVNKLENSKMEFRLDCQPKRNISNILDPVAPLKAVPNENPFPVCVSVFGISRRLFLDVHSTFNRRGVLKSFGKFEKLKHFLQFKMDFSLPNIIPNN